jgi:TBC domain-containing protein kinase-like protein
LFNHLDGIGFIPDLYAIPWILTMFAHVFPLQNIFHLWDKLLLGNSAFPLCIGLAVLVQLRERLLCSEFNDCILLFSDLPAIDIEKCVKDSVQIFCTTPKSLTWRKYGSRKLGSEDDDEDPAIAELRMDSVTLAQQKSEKVPRMSAEELLTLLGVDVSCGRKGRRRRYESGDPDADRGPASPRSSLVLVLDVRPVDEFKLGAVQDSVNVPFCSADAVNKMMSDLSEMKRGKVVCVVGARNHEKDAIALAESLLEAGHSRVCLMHGGVEVLKAVEGALRVPNG